MTKDVDNMAWTQNEEGTWTPSATDRRRLATSLLVKVCDDQGGKINHLQIAAILELFTTGTSEDPIYPLFASWADAHLRT